MQVILTSKANEDLIYWKKSGNKAILKKIDSLIESIIAAPCTGIGKPEALKHSFWGLWSRRIDREHRIVYRVEESIIEIYSLRGHYN